MSWYVMAVIEAIIMLSLTTILVYALRVFQTTSVTLFMVSFLLYIVSYIPLAQVYSLFFQEPKTAALVSGISFTIILISWVLMRFVVLNLVPSLWIKFVFYLFSPFAFCDFMYFLSIYENTQGASLGWTTMNETFPIWHCLLFLFVDGIIYLLLALYLDKVMPCKYSSIITNSNSRIWSRIKSSFLFTKIVLVKSFQTVVTSPRTRNY